MIGPRKRLAFHLIMVFVVILSIEAGAQVIFFAYKGFFPVQRRPAEKFNVREFTVVTSDARGFTGIPHYTNPNYQGWFLSFDSFGFRRGKHTTSSSGQPNIVFIGDSVPFGWGVSDISSLPSKFFERLQENSIAFGVINAALPSYSLAQAVARYEQEIHGRMAVDIVYLQIYDPVSQLVARGSSWQPGDNWMNYPYRSTSFLSHFGAALSHYSAATAIVAGVASRLNIDFGGAKSGVEKFDPDDVDTTSRVRAAVRADLERLLAMNKAEGVRQLIVAPLTIPTHSLNSYSHSRISAIELINQALRVFASSHSDNVIFADTISLLKKYPEADVFIDRCCHLSERGNGIIADYLMTLLLDFGHFARNEIPGKITAK
jgi:hypothetical protein